MLITVPTTPYQDQRFGTSGLRKKVLTFQQESYVENFIQSIFNTIEICENKTLVIGGDGRFYNLVVIQKIIKMASANGFSRVILGKGGILSTPAVSHIIRKYKACGGIILSASHNPAGPMQDFGIKYNISNGAPASEQITEAIFAESMKISSYKTLQSDDIDIENISTKKLSNMHISIIDPIEDYVELMEKIFDFDAIRDLISFGFRIDIDCMNAVTGPYAKEILEVKLGAPTGSVRNFIPLEDFGEICPDPNLVHGKDLYNRMMTDNCADFGAALDGDGDRNMIVGKGIFVNPSDSLAIMVANAGLIHGYSSGLVGVARSMPTSTSLDRVADKLDLKLFEVPTGWKFFSNLFDYGLITICGEESFGNGSDHSREKDGIWAVLFWLNIIAVRGESLSDIVHKHWATYGRNYYSRYDYNNIPTDNAQALMKYLNSKLLTLVGSSFIGKKIEKADNFIYTDPISGDISDNQGIRIVFEDYSRIIYRLSGTDTQNITLRVYIDYYEPDSSKHLQDTQKNLAGLVEVSKQISCLRHYIGNVEPIVAI
ncbi:alpha-D-glucose phosphate-specific phosphoglucomutase [Candidatus Liberibacter americanus]|uniref:phosphoglucomutase (alpha-D-glucose-1,6-bisphosphate-dependent) n=1 Tax=Candidatus Liberibacter americanus str. Sao Paulo TaxID=1261131 RepID=U6B8B7_9HYPH|nr:alpha-D-glucose phosphate-specific phosphoglucomutase [Candidatus Liberibacter americanus]AHA27977.1 Phosphoglucomutase [Candidatus Liberibacter americanus str. Sao Paulo]EMS35876.1 phosphoglucomutase [Candidatus Liberibacter americanus PW_SP]